MAGFDDSLVREYFEMNGFFVRQSRKYAVQSRRKRADEEGDLLVINPSPRRGGPPRVPAAPPPPRPPAKASVMVIVIVKVEMSSLNLNMLRCYLQSVA